jgi:ADP-ribose diphosphatase
MPEIIVAERTVFRGRNFRVLERDIKLSESKTVTWEVLDKGTDSVAIVAIDEDTNVWLVEEYFGGANERCMCLPKGRIDPGEDPAETAARELREEIGMRGKLERLLTMSVSPGYLTQRTELFLATDLHPDPLPGDEVHHLAPVRIPLAGALDMCGQGVITEARTIGALMLVGRRLGL